MSVTVALASIIGSFLLYIQYLFSAFHVIHTTPVRYATCTRLNHGYVGTWANDVAIQTDKEAPPFALTQTNHHINHIVVLFSMYNVWGCTCINVSGMHVALIVRLLCDIRTVCIWKGRNTLHTRE